MNNQEELPQVTLQEFKLKFWGGAEVKRLNVRKQGDDDNAVMAVDLKLSGECRSDCLPRILGCEEHEIACFWRNDEAQNPIFTGITDIVSWACFESCALTISDFDEPFRGVKVKNIKFTPTANRMIVLTLSASITDVNNSDLAMLARLLNEKTDCEITAQPEFNFSGDTSAKSGFTEVQQDLLEDAAT